MHYKSKTSKQERDNQTFQERVQLINHEIARLQSRLNQKEIENTELHQNLGRLACIDSQLSFANDENKKLVHKAGELQTELAKIQHELDSKIIETEHYSKILSEVQQHNEKLSRENQKLNSDHILLARKHTQQDNQISELHRQLGNSKESQRQDKENHNKQIIITSENLTIEKENNKELNEQLEKLKNELLREQKEKEQKIQALTEQLDQVNNSSSHLYQEANTKDTTIKQLKLESSQQRNNYLELENQHQDKILEASRLQEQLQKQILESEEKQAELIKKESHSHELQGEINTTREINEKLKSENAILEKELAKAKEQVEEYKSNTLDLSKQLEEEKVERDSVESQMVRQKDMAQKNLEEKHQITTELTREKEKNKDLENQIKDLESQTKDHSPKTNHQNHEMALLNEKLAKLKADYQISKSANTRNLETIKRKDDELQELHVKVDKLEKSAEDMAHKFKSATDHSKSLNEKLQQSVEEAEKLSNDLSTENKKLESITQEFENFKLQSETAINDAKKSEEKNTEVLKNKMTELQQSLDRTHAEKTRLLADIRDLIKDNKTLESELENITRSNKETELMVSREEYESMMERFHEDLNKAEEITEEYKNQLEASNQHIEELEELIQQQTQKTEHDTLKEELEKANQRIKEMQEQLDNQNDSIVEQDSIKSLNKNLGTGPTETSDLKTMFQKKEAELGEALQAKNKMEAELKKISRAKTDLENKLQQYSDGYDNDTGIVSNLNKQITDLRTKTDRIEEESAIAIREKEVAKAQADHMQSVVDALMQCMRDKFGENDDLYLAFKKQIDGTGINYEDNDS